MEPSEYAGSDGVIQPRRAGGDLRVVGEGRVPIQAAHEDLTVAEEAMVLRRAGLREAAGVLGYSEEQAERDLRGES